MAKLKPSKWLVCFVRKPEDTDFTEENIKIFTNDIEKIAEHLNITEKGKYVITYVSHAELKNIGSAPAEPEVIFGDLELYLFNEVVSKKKEKGCGKVAVVFPRRAFYNDQTYRLAVDRLADAVMDSHSLCCNEDFIDLSKTGNCRQKSCAGCLNFDNCGYGCRLRLVWLLFDENDAAVEYFKVIHKNDKS